MSDGVFVDTNILIYAHDADAGDKRERAARRLRELWTSGTGCLSVQVLQEFYVNVTRKLSTPIALASARQIVSAYAVWVRSPSTAQTVVRATEISESAQISFWDAMILAAAEECDAALLWSEDLNTGQTIAGIKVVNPLQE
jgi:predicted nucleic acid-binding protein